MPSAKERLKQQLARLARDSHRFLVSGSKLKRLLRQLDPTRVVISDVGLDIFVEGTPQEPNGDINIDTFVEWLYEDENNSLPESMPEGTAAPQIHVYWSNHMTPGMTGARRDWFSKLLGAEQADESAMSIKASMPPFNNALKLPLPDTVLQLNVPVYGPNIPNAVMRLFEHAEMRDIAGRLMCTLPPYVLNDIVQQKMDKVLHMVQAARRHQDIAESNRGPIDRLEGFAKALQGLRADEIPDLDAWTAFVNRHSNSGWEHKLHFDHLLDNFGFSKEASDTLRALNHVSPSGENVPYEQHAFRWLGKAFSAYGPLGCMTDVVNLIFAMIGVLPVGLQETRISEHIDMFREKVHSQRDLANLWIPSFFVMDAESDDTLSWVLLEYLHNMRGSTLQTFVQLCADPSLDGIAAKLGSFHDVHIFRDPEARNLKPVQKNFGVL